MYRVVVEKGPEALHVWETPENVMALLGLDPGVLYTVTVTPCGCQGRPVHVSVRTGEATAENTMIRSCFKYTESSMFGSSSRWCAGL